MAKKKPKRKKKFRGEKKDRPPVMPRGVWPKVFALLLWLLTLIFSLSFFGKAGIGGEWLLKGFVFLAGKTIYALPLILALSGFFIFKTRYRHYFLPSLLGILFLILGTAGILAIQGGEERWGGIVGYFFVWPLLKLFGFWVSQIVSLALILVAGIIFLHLWRRPHKEEPSPLPAPAVVKEPEVGKEEPKEVKPRRPFLPKLSLGSLKASPKSPSEKPEAPEFVKGEEVEVKKTRASFTPFPLDLLAAERGEPNSGDINRNSALIKNTLENFEIPVEMAQVNVGPTVTQYTLKPAEGIKLSRITALHSNLALALAAHPLRIEAPIPGKALVGIEVPNKERAEVRLRNLLERPEFKKAASPLILALGRDVAGHPIFADLDRMPHLLVAGSTGTGKTIFLNSLVLSLLQKNSPETLRFILIDPKRVEFQVYHELPHLLGPVIFDADKAVLTIRWLIGEMEKRFKQLSAAGARDIASYNQAIRKRVRAPGEASLVMPYVVLIVDELADLMAAKGREIEAGIVRLAQMARAVGIHLVVATQRPSVEVLTGLIKANITSRVTFQVATQIDSRTVLDMAGAERLLGRGDMLFISSQTPKPKRVQAAFVSEREMRKVINWLRSRQEYLSYNSLNSSLAEALSQELAEGGEEKGREVSSGKDEDVLYEEAKRVVIEARKASASLLQRRLRIGYARAARLLDLLEERGVVGPAEGAKPRQVYGARVSQEQERGFEEFE